MNELCRATRLVAVSCVATMLLAAAPALAQWSDATTPVTGDTVSSHGATWADFDGDGDLDLYVANNGPNRLLRNDGLDGGSGDWIFTDLATPGVGIGYSGVSSVGVWGDYDGDGDPDLYLSNTQGANQLFRNDPLDPLDPQDLDRVFVDVTNSPELGSTRSTHPACWVDYDGDGDLDLYQGDVVTNYLLRNDGEDPLNPGEWIFTDVTAATGTASSFDSEGAAWADFDDDGDQDLYLVNYSGLNQLLRNDGGVFTDVAVSMGVADPGTGRGASWGDFDNDGDLDLYVTNYAQANRLYRNDGASFVEIGAAAGVADLGNGRGCTWVDTDNDGDLDLFLTNFDNGVVSQDNVLYRNDGGVFTADTDTLLAGDGAMGATACWADFDADGDLDAYLANWNPGAPNKLVRNDSAGANHFLQVTLAGTSSNTSGIGGRVVIEAGGVSQLREINGGESFHSQNTLTAEFGLGAATVVDTLTVYWPSGFVQGVGALAADQFTLITEPSPDTPTIDPEPPYTSGTANTVSWSDESASGAVDYEVQASEDLDFAVIWEDSGWIPGLSYEFTGLSDGQQLYYRVRSRDAQAFLSGWSDVVVSVQDDAVPVSSVDAIAGPREAYPFAVTVSSSDTGSGVDTVELWFRVDAGPWTLFGTNPAADPFDFTVPAGVGFYEFYSVATDFLANVEPKIPAPEASVEIVAPTWVNVLPLDGSGAANDGNSRGVAWGDYDGDGDHDLFITNRPVYFTGADATNHLFRDDGPGGPDEWLYTDVTEPGMADPGYGQGAAWGDFDGDGDLDLYQGNMSVGSDAPNHLYRNNGDGTFSDIAPITGTDDPGSARSVNWVDYDLDGDLDLYLANDGQNRLWRNDGEDPFAPGDWLFVNVAPLDGTGVGDDSYTMGCAWADYDNDGDPDLYLANYDGGTNRLFRNDGGGVFVDVANAMQVDDVENGMGVAWGDFDGDGWFDFYLTNQGPNRLFRQVPGENRFEDLAGLIGNGLDDAVYSAGCAWGDYDNDGDLDLYLANHWSDPMGDSVPNRLFRNDGPDAGPGGWLFNDAASPDGQGSGDDANTTGVAWSDFDGDGDLDIYLSNMTAGLNKLLRNDVADTTGNHWLHLDMVSKSSNTAGIGARVRCKAGGAWQFREVEGGSGFLSQNSLTLEFGLGAAAVADSIEVLWPSGIVQTLVAVAADQRLTVVEPGPDVPVCNPLPVFSSSTGRRIDWSDESATGAIEYQVQRADDASFLNVQETSAWMPDTTFVFTGLVDGMENHYRVRARDGLMIESGWSAGVFTTQDYTPPITFVDPIEILFQGVPFTVTYAYEDTVSGVDYVELWYSHNNGLWYLYDTVDAGEPFIFELPDGLGFYKFVSKAYDNVGNPEIPPSVADQTVTVTEPQWVLVSPTDGSGVGDDGNGRGVAWGDYDGDSDPDLYISNRIAYQSGADPENHLFRNDGEDILDPESWLFEDVTAPPMNDDDYGQGVAWADFDGDGDLDLYQVNMQVNPSYPAPNLLYRNNGDGTFTDIAAAAGVNDGGSGRSCSWADFDQDGDLDLYLCQNGRNRLWRNDGEDTMNPDSWLFTDVAPADSTGIGDGVYTMGNAWADYDRDGDLDLYLANYEGGPNRLFRNDGPDTLVVGEWMWTDVAPALGLDNAELSLGCTWGDLDNDGDLDLFVTNDGPNALYRNLGDGETESWLDIAPLIGDGLDDANYGSGCGWADFDNDGDLDLYAGTHWYESGDPAPNFLFRNDGEDLENPDSWSFVNVAPSNGFSIADDASTNGLAWVDFDGDGDLDLYLATMLGLTNKLFRNDVADSTGNHWFQVDLLTTDSNTNGIGATVRATVNGVTMQRTVDGGSGFLSQQPARLSFGLGAATQVDVLEVTWPDGSTQSVGAVPADQVFLFQQSVTSVDETERPNLPTVFAVHGNYPNPFNPSTTIRFDLPREQRVRIVVHALDGSRVRTLVDGVMPGGRHLTVWDGRDGAGRGVASGVYFYRVVSDDAVVSRKMLLVK